MTHFVSVLVKKLKEEVSVPKTKIPDKCRQVGVACVINYSADSSPRHLHVSVRTNLASHNEGVGVCLKMQCVFVF